MLVDELDTRKNLPAWRFRDSLTGLDLGASR